jgi:hypothetical protein
MEMWTILRFAPTCPHLHSPYYGFAPRHRQPEAFPNCKLVNIPLFNFVKNKDKKKQP